jgi:hypothetical protein
MIEVAEKIATISDAAATKFTNGTTKTERSIYNKILAILKDLDLNADGTIKTTQANVKILRKVRANMLSIILTDEYKKNVDNYLGTFEDIKGVNDAYFQSLGTSFNANKIIYEEILSQTVNQTKKSLLDAGINQFVIDPVDKLLTQNVTSGGLFSDMVETMRVTILGDPERLGGLQRYASQITRDSLNQYARNYQQSVTSDIGFEWFFYSGQLVSDSRSYCVEREGKYFHKNEVMDSVSGQWSGKIPGTNSSTIFTYAGGYNCGHSYLPVTISQVPQSAIDRNIASGNYNAN